MSTVLDIIKGSMRLIGAIAPSENPTPDEAQDALSVLNDMVDAWNNEPLMIYVIQTQVFNFQAGKVSYTIGAGGDFNVPRPPQIDTAYVRTPQGQDLPLDLINDAEYAAITIKSTQSSIPMKMRDDGNYPLKSLYFWPVPSDASYQVVINSWTPISSFTGINQEVSFPPGYKKALRYLLALELAAEYGKSAPAEVVAIANESKAQIKRKNFRQNESCLDAALVGKRRTFNWLNDE